MYSDPVREKAEYITYIYSAKITRDYRGEGIWSLNRPNPFFVLYSAPLRLVIAISNYS